MRDTIEHVMADMLAADPAASAVFSPRIDALYQKLTSETEAAREESRKGKARLRAEKSKSASLKRENAKLKREYEQLKEKFDRLFDECSALKHEIFGASADRVHTDKKSGPSKCEGAATSQKQKSPSHAAVEDAAATDKKPNSRNRQGRGKRQWPKHLERRPVYMGTEDRTCPCGCGGGIYDIETVETLEVVPASFYVAVHQYPKYRCRLEDRRVGTKRLPRIFSKTTVSASVLAHLATMRFAWSLPWYRQERMLEEHGINLNRSTMLRWSNNAASRKLKYIVQMMEADLKNKSTRLFMDETPIPMLAPGQGRTRTTFLYALHRDDRSFGGNLPPVVIYYPRPSRAMSHIHDILDGLTVIVQSDAFSGYGQLGRQGTPVEGITSANCWTHARRKFTDEFKINKTADATEIVNIINELYAVDEGIRGKPPPVRVAARQEYSAPILSRLRKRLIELTNHHLSESRMAKAIRYTLGHWDGLTLFVDYGRIDLDTNPVERMFKPTILLRKNALFMGSDEGAEAWGILSSIVETCKLNRVRVEPYLKWVFDEMTSIVGEPPASECERLLPWNAPAHLRLQ